MVTINAAEALRKMHVYGLKTIRAFCANKRGSRTFKEIIREGKLDYLYQIDLIMLSRRS